ncbi:MAG: invasion associated locus B family protein [Hyphomicrobiaceae bacterium]
MLAENPGEALRQLAAERKVTAGDWVLRCDTDEAPSRNNCTISAESRVSDSEWVIAIFSKDYAGRDEWNMRALRPLGFGVGDGVPISADAKQIALLKINSCVERVGCLADRKMSESMKDRIADAQHIGVSYRLSETEAAVFRFNLSGLKRGMILMDRLFAVASEPIETATDKFNSQQPEKTSLAPTASAASTSPSPRVVVAPVIGAPDTVADMMRQAMIGAIGQQKVIVSGVDEKADFVLRGYVVAFKASSGVKISYIWDVTGSQGLRLNRFADEEATKPDPNVKDPWSVVTPQIAELIGQKIAPLFGAWLKMAPQQSKFVSRQSSPNSVPATAALSDAAPAATAAVAPHSAADGEKTHAGNDGSGLPNLETLKRHSPVKVNSVSGRWPDDALKGTMISELRKLGVEVSEDESKQGDFVIDLNVKLKKPVDGMQDVEISWELRNSVVGELGTLMQKKSVRVGLTAEEWIQEATGAAAEGAESLVGLLRTHLEGLLTASQVAEARPAIGVRLASGPSRDSMRLSWSVLSNSHSALQLYQPRIKAMASGNVHELVAGPFKSKSEAEKLCSILKARGVACTLGEFYGDAQ